ncbi:MAG: NAD(P)H-hydrate dehydratase [Negativicutes bacterium]|nr:NAD(P)H-hydrate dehydratase [Negativicutes bacterium]
MKVVTAKQMLAIDRAAIEDFGIPGIVLMENAAVAVADQVVELLGDARGKRVCIVAGKGNNAGDGFAAARHLSNRGAEVRIFLLYPPAELAADAKSNFDVTELMGIDFINIESEQDFDKFRLGLMLADCVVDAIFGIGFRGAIEPRIARAINMINSSGKMVVAIDVPSGIDPDSGRVDDMAVVAVATVTMSLPKLGLLLYPAASYAGDWRVADIGLPASLLRSVEFQTELTGLAEVRDIWPVRPPDAHKGKCGRVAVIAGSRGMAGAAALTALGAMYTGSGLVRLAAPDRICDVLAGKITEAVIVPLADGRSGVLGLEGLDRARELMAGSDVLAIGPGIGQEDSTALLVWSVIKECTVPLVIDADALNILAGQMDMLKTVKFPIVITPHPGEMARLLGTTAAEVNADRVEIARKAAVAWQVTVVLKGAPTVVATPAGWVYINSSGNEQMATGGSGDVLTGMIASLIAQGLNGESAAVAAVYAHGLAGEIASTNSAVILAGDIGLAIPTAISQIRES